MSCTRWVAVTVKLHADEGVDREIVERLRSDGHEVSYVAEMDKGVTDETVLRSANARGAILVTQDKDFGELVFRQKLASGGILLLRLAGLASESKAELVSAILQDHGSEMIKAFSVLTKTSLRIRHK